MRIYTQAELLEEGFWDIHKSPLLRGMGKVAKTAAKGVGGAFGAAVKGGAYLVDKAAPELTAPIHRLESGIRGFGQALRKGWDVGSGGLKKEYEDILLDNGYVMDKTQDVQRTGKNRLVIGYRILGHDIKGEPIYDNKRPLTFLFDKDGNFKIVSSSSQHTVNFSSGGSARNFAKTQRAASGKNKP